MNTIAGTITRLIRPLPCHIPDPIRHLSPLLVILTNSSTTSRTRSITCPPPLLMPPPRCIRPPRHRHLLTTLVIHTHTRTRTRTHIHTRILIPSLIHLLTLNPLPLP